ncbi:hypothetical protein BH23BAC1_BH23BAC1_45090 [soil metagenome]
MTKSKKDTKNMIQWTVLIAIMAIVYFTGFHTEVIGTFQRVILATGIIKPQTNTSVASIEEYEMADKDNYLYDFKLLNVNGQKVNLKDLEGKIVFFNIWATWCPPCIAEMPNIHSLYKKTDPAKIAFVMLSVDKNQQKAKDFIQKKKYEFPVYFPGGSTLADFQANVIPTTFILDTNGKILTRHEGMADYDNAEFINYLEKLSKPDLRKDL